MILPLPDFGRCDRGSYSLSTLSNTISHRFSGPFRHLNTRATIVSSLSLVMGRLSNLAIFSKLDCNEYSESAFTQRMYWYMEYFLWQYSRAIWVLPIPPRPM